MTDDDRIRSRRLASGQAQCLWSSGAYPGRQSQTSWNRARLMNVNPRNLVIFAVIALLMLWAVVTQLWSPAQHPASQDISFSQLLHDVDQARVRDVVIQGQEIRGTYKDGRAFSTYAPSTYTPSDPTFVQRLYSKDVVITARPPDEAPWFVSLLISWLPFIALIGVDISIPPDCGRWRQGVEPVEKRCDI